MLSRLADRIRLRTGTDTSTPPVRAVAAIAPFNLLVGDQVHGHVDSVQPGGIFKVLIENQPLLLRLPFNAQSGDTIQLTVIAREPKLKFEINDYPAPPVQASRLSDTARFITALLAESEKLPVAPVTLSGTPLLTAMPGNSAVLAAALSNALAESGMFYESHQAQWVNGERPLTRLLNEPQAGLPRLALSSGPVGVTDHSSADDIPVPGPTPDLPVHRDALAIVRQQLDTLDTRHVVWQGLIWPDQPIEWQISEQPSHAGTRSDDPQWQTHVKLTLPRLREVGATLLIGKRGVAIALHTALADTAIALAAQRARLQQSLRDAGVTPLGITVNAHATP